MSDSETEMPQRTAVDDVRLVREKIASGDSGDIRKHIEETNRIGEELRAKLNVRPLAGSLALPLAASGRSNCPET
jgi:hypothetical protein